MNRIPCAHCGRDFIPNPRVKNQRYCNHPECQRVRKTLWQRQKLVSVHPEMDNFKGLVLEQGTQIDYQE